MAIDAVFLWNVLSASHKMRMLARNVKRRDKQPRIAKYRGPLGVKRVQNDAKFGDAAALSVCCLPAANHHAWQIKEATGMTNVSDMVNNFLQAEEKNFSLFNFVNELNRCVHPRVTAQPGPVPVRSARAGIPLSRFPPPTTSLF